MESSTTKLDHELQSAILAEEERQNNSIELIASENFVSQAVLETGGSILTNKYAEGYPGRRYYSGCQHVDKVENLAIERAKKLFNCQFANVQPHSGSQANAAAYAALMKPNGKLLGMSLKAGGHLTHGYKVSFSGTFYQGFEYGVNDQGWIDYDEVKKIAISCQPDVIVAGASAYSRIVDFKKFREIADHVNAKLMVDMAHIAGLIATNHHPSPFPYAHLVTSTTHKTLRGARGGLILANEPDIAKAINKWVFPGMQGGPLMHQIAGKAVCFYEALQPEFKVYIHQVIKNSQAFAQYFANQNIPVISGGTDNHLFSIDVKNGFGVTGKFAADLLEELNITVNKNTIPNDSESPFVTSGLRLGTPAMTTKGFKETEFQKVAEIICHVLRSPNDTKIRSQAKHKIIDLANKFSI